MKLIFRSLSLVILCLALYGGLKVNAQQTDSCNKVTPDPRLYECFESSFIETQLEKNPDLILYYNYFLDHSYYLTDLPPKEDFVQSLKVLDFSADEDLSKLNVLKYKLELSNDRITYYRLGPRDKIIVFYSGKDFTRMYNEYMVSLGKYEPRTSK